MLGDALCLDAIRELRRDVDVHAQQQALLRFMDAHAGLALHRLWSRWVAFCDVSDATLPLEDELIIAQRELRRAQRVIESFAVAELPR